jgi:Helix-turn-helix domain
MTGTQSISASISLAPQPRKILAHLLKGKDITNNESMLVYGIYRLSDCILKIRRAGYEVITDRRRDEVGRQYASYSLYNGVLH